MELLRFVMDNVLGPVFDHDLAMVSGATATNLIEDQEIYQELERETSSSSSSREANSEGRRSEKIQARDKTSSSSSSWCQAGDAILDSSGPKLVEGMQNWLFFYQLIGHVNLSRQPLYLALTYRLLVFVSTNYVMQSHFIIKIIQMHVLAISFTNPIFVLISFLTLVTGFLNALAIFYTGTFNLCPMFKILTTPQLCFINRRTQHALGSTTLKYMLVFFMYQTLLLNLLVHETFEQFIYNFSPMNFLLECFTVMACSYSYVGLANLDFYVRSCFGAWLLALATNLECRQARFERMHQEPCQLAGGAAARELSADHAHSLTDTPTRPARASIMSRSSRGTRRGRETRRMSVMSRFQESYLFISLDEIQKSLNAMDDHLEVTRTIQTFSLVLIDLLAFLASGGLFLIAYNALAKANDIYHGSVFLLLALNFAFLVMLTYLGDSFIFYALGKLVQTVEDEYFLQETCEQAGQQQHRFDSAEVHSTTTTGGGSVNGDPGTSQEEGQGQLCDLTTRRVMTTRDWIKPPEGGDLSQEQQVDMGTTGHDEPRPAARANLTTRHDRNGVANKQLLSIKRSDVLFCRELLEQFENHLATPWSKLTFKAHLNIMATFATLVAAQIIFDSH